MMQRKKAWPRAMLHNDLELIYSTLSPRADRRLLGYATWLCQRYLRRRIGAFGALARCGILLAQHDSRAP